MLPFILVTFRILRWIRNGLNQISIKSESLWFIWKKHEISRENYVDTGPDNLHVDASAAIQHQSWNHQPKRNPSERILTVSWKPIFSLKTESIWRLFSRSMVEFIFIEIADLKPKGKKLKVSYKGTVAICKVSCKVAKEISGQFFLFLLVLPLLFLLLLTLTWFVKQHCVQIPLPPICRILRNRWVNVFKNGPSKICGRRPLKNSTWSILEYLDPDEVYIS